jgi:hypothetical protein
MSSPRTVIKTCLGSVKWHPDYTWERVKKLIKKSIKSEPESVDVFNYDDWGYNSLATALYDFDDVKFAKFLLRSHANPNIDICGVHSNKLIFFAKSVEALELLKQYGADLTQFNQGKGCTNGMNLLHASLHDQLDDSIFDYLIKEGFDPHVKTLRGANLWHTLLWFSRYCPTDRLYGRAQKIKRFGISIHDCNPNDHYWNLTPLEYLDSMINEEYKNHSDSPFHQKFMTLRQIIVS